jgi:hypothetical protein
MDPTVPLDPSQSILVRTYLAIFGFIAQRARQGDLNAMSFERQLTQPLQPYPSHTLVRSWLATVASERQVVRRTADMWVARDLINKLNVAESRAGALGPQTWVELVTAIRSGSMPRP